MSSLHQFIQEHFALCFCFAVLWVLSFGTWRFFRHRKHGISFPPLESVRVQFHESGASGRSLKSPITRFGGASNCLLVTVTDKEVWVRTFFPFNLLARDFDLEHRIPREAITRAGLRVGWSRRQIELEFRDASGMPRQLLLSLRNPDAFLTVLKEIPPPIPS
jgi:hypothetical protein